MVTATRPNPMANPRPDYPIAAKFKGPGPAAYTLPSSIGRRNPAYSFGIKLKSKAPSLGPGPNSFFPKVNRNGAGGGPRFSIQGGYKKYRLDGRAVVYSVRPDAAVDVDTPGPAKYNPADLKSSSRRSAPQYTIIGRRPHSHTDIGPGPATYSLSSTVGSAQTAFPTAPVYTIQPARRQKKADNASAGPAAYSKPHPSVTHKSAPHYSLGARWKRQKNDELPGPGAYNLDSSRGNAAPAYSFRIKHSEYEVYVGEWEANSGGQDAPPSLPPAQPAPVAA